MSDPPHLCTSQTALEAARRSLDQGNLRQALDELRCVPNDLLHSGQLVEALSLLCRTAFRVGEHGQAIEAGGALLDRCDAGSEAGLAARFDALAVVVVSAGELARFELSLERLPELVTLAGRRRDMSHWVRARGTAASVLCLLGDPWAAQRVLAHVKDRLERHSGYEGSAPTVYSNLVSIELLIARMAGEAGELRARDAALARAEELSAHAEALATARGDDRLRGLGTVHRLEIAILAGASRVADPESLEPAIAGAERSGRDSQVRQLLLLRAEVWLGWGAPELAKRDLDRAQSRIHEGAELSVQIRARQLLGRTERALARWQEASVHDLEADRLSRFLAWRLAWTQSTHARARLELEHLFLSRPFAG
jgi:hypothetical protein